MSTGSIANAAFTYGVIHNGQYDLTTRERLLLLLLAEVCVSGIGEIELEAFVRFTAAPDAASVHEDLKSLSRHDLLRVSDIHEGNVAVALAIAEPDEIEAARRHLYCHLPFRDWTGKR